MRVGSFKNGFAIAAAAMSVSTMLSSAQAADVTWDNGAADGLWTSGSNWSTDAVPTDADTAIIGGTAPAAIDPTGSGTVDAVRLTRAVTLNGGTITMDAVTNAPSNNGVLALNLGAGVNAAINSNLNFSGSDATNFNFVNLVRANSSGTTTIAGTVTNAANIGGAGSNFVDISGAAGVDATIIFNGAITSTRTTGNTEFMLNRGTVEFNAANTWNTGGAGLRALTAVGTGTGTLRLGHANALGTGTVGFSMGSTDNTSSNTHTMQVLQTGTNTIANGVTIRNNSNVNILGADIASGTATFSGPIRLRNVTTGGTANQIIFKSVQSGGTVAMSGLIQNDNTAQTVVRNLTIGQASTGVGTVAFTRAAGNTYTGNTTVAAGTLLVSNTSGSATGTGTVNVASGATLGGTGIISGATSIAGTLAPGASAGTLAFGGLLSLSPDAILSYELDALTMAAGGGVNDLTTVGGDLTLDGTLNVASASPLGEGTWRLFNYSGSLIDSILNIGSINLVESGTATIDTSTVGQVNLVVAVPEPTPFAALALGGVALLRRRRSN